MKRIYVVAFAFVAVMAFGALLTGCNGEAAMEPQDSKTVSADEAEVVAEAEAPEPLTSEGIIDAFKAAGLAVGTVEIYDATTDPNTQLGRPGMYVAKMNWADTNLEQADGDLTGGSIESFSKQEDMQNRIDYIQGIIKELPIMNEYQFTNGMMLLRLDSGLTPEQAEAYNTVFQTLGK